MLESKNNFRTWAYRTDESFYHWINFIPEDWESCVIRNNVRSYDRLFTHLKNRCAAPGCGYPLRDVDNFKLPFIGDVCNLCFDVYSAVQRYVFFVNAHREWEEIQKKLKRNTGNEGTGGHFG